MLIEKPTGEIQKAYDHDNEPYLFEAKGKEAKHFCAILRAEDDGRLVILPKTLYEADTTPLITGVTEWEVTGVRYYDGTVQAYTVQTKNVQTIIYGREIGKTVFLSREEADAALKGKAADNGV